MSESADSKEQQVEGDLETDLSKKRIHNFGADDCDESHLSDVRHYRHSNWRGSNRTMQT